MDKPKTVIAMDLPLFVEAICEAVADRVDIVGTARDARGVLELLTTTEANVVLTAVDIGEGGGCALCATIKSDERFGTTVRVLVIGNSDDHENLVDAVHAGADGYVAEDGGVVELLDALDRMGRGEASIPGAMLGELLRTLISDRREEDRAIERFSRLSYREREVLALLVDGLDNARIAERMTVSTNTARTHVQNIFRKLEVGSRLEAASLVSTFDLLDRFPVEDPQGA